MQGLFDFLIRHIDGIARENSFIFTLFYTYIFSILVIFHVAELQTGQKDGKHQIDEVPGKKNKNCPRLVWVSTGQKHQRPYRCADNGHYK